MKREQKQPKVMGFCTQLLTIISPHINISAASHVYESGYEAPEAVFLPSGGCPESLPKNSVFDKKGFLTALLALVHPHLYCLRVIHFRYGLKNKSCFSVICKIFLFQASST